MAIVLLALIGALVVTALLAAARLALSRRGRGASQSLVSWLGTIFIVNFLIDLLILYFSMPAFAGPYGGWQWILGPLLLSGIISLLISGVFAGQQIFQTLAQGGRLGSSGRVVNMQSPSMRSLMADGAGVAGVAAIGLSLFISIILNSVISIGTTWFDPNAKALAAIPHIVMQPQSQPLPATNVNHIVLVTQGIAFFKGQQVLGQNGKNLGSTYHIVQEELTLQSVQKHLYWIAPLVYNNIWANLGNYDTPGLVVVDAENPDAAPQLRTGYHLHYVPDALFNQEIVRHVYLSGYTNGDLVDPTLEVDDNWNPFFTISLMQPSRGFTGETLHQVLLVDPQSGDIKTYDPANVPSWVDRVVPKSVVSDYLGWWGLYNSAPWFDPAGTGQQKIAGAPELVYNDVDQPVWLVPMTSSAATDNSSTGIMLFDTKKNEAQLYPLSGLGVGDNVTSTFSKNPKNIRNYDVGSVQLYTIYGVPTWLAVFTQSTSQGDTFQSVGLVAAKDLSGANVQMETSIGQSLIDYQQWLASHGTGSQGNPGAGGSTQTTVTGKVVRIAPVTQNNSTSYYITIEGQSHIFLAPLSLSAKLPLVLTGDTVTVTYLSAATTSVINLSSFDDTTIDLGASPTATSGTPGTTQSPSVTPVATAAVQRRP